MNNSMNNPKRNIRTIHDLSKQEPMLNSSVPINNHQSNYKNSNLQHSIPARNSTLNPNDANTTASNFSLSPSAMSGMNTMGSYNRYGSSGFGGYGGGLGYPGMGMSMYGGYGMMGPMSWIYSLNYFIMSIGQIMDMLGMNSYAIMQLFQKIKDSIGRMETLIRQSEFRRWLQRKSRKSKLLRFLFVFISMAIASQVVRLVRMIIESQLKISIPNKLSIQNNDNQGHESYKKGMSQFDIALSSAQKEVSESSYEYLLGEILALNYVTKTNDQAAASIHRLDMIGYDVGYRLIEKVASNHKFIGTEPLDLVKFICKEFWEEVFKKKVDKLQTNHRGVFVLSDTKFKWLEKYSSDDIVSKQAAARMLNFPCGMLRGALANLGVLTIVNADFNTLPACIFNIRIKT